MSDEDARSIVVVPADRCRRSPQGRAAAARLPGQPAHQVRAEAPDRARFRAGPEGLRWPTASTSSRSPAAASCHTPHDDKGQPIAGLDFSGGWVMVGPWGRVVTANITPDPDNYMGQASRDEFIGRFKSFESVSTARTPRGAGRQEHGDGRGRGFSGMTTRGSRRDLRLPEDGASPSRRRSTRSRTRPRRAKARAKS